MQGYTWSSNQRPSPRYQDRPPPQYQERLPHQYQERPPPQYQERLPHQYQERPPPQYQERLPHQYQEQYPPQYHAARNDQPNAFQGQFMPQLQTTQERYYNGQQEAANQWRACSGNVDSNAFQQNEFNWLKRTNQMHPQYQWQWHDCSPQNYRNTDCSQAPMYCSQQSDNCSSNSRGWNSHNSNNSNSCSMNNQQQLQPARMAPHHHHQQQQQQYSRQYSGKKRRHHTQTYSRSYNMEVSKKNSNSQAQSRAEASHTSCNSTTPPSGAQSNVSKASNNLNQSPVNHNQPEPGSNASPDVSAIQSQNNQNAGHQSQGTNNGTYNINQASQMTQASETPLHSHARKLSSYVDSIIYRLLCTDDKEEANKQQSDEKIAHQNTCPEQSEVCATKKTDNHSFSEPSAQCTVEPPSKRLKYAVIQRDRWNKLTIVSKDKSDFEVQSAQPGTHRSSSNGNRCKGTSQHTIQYITDPADCLEVVFALQKSTPQSHKAIAIVPPISQQTSNATPTADTSPKKPDSPPLKIDSVWSIAEESNEQKTVNDKLSESSTQITPQENKSLATESNIESPDTCFASPVEGQNDLPQSDSVSSDPSFDLSTVPVTEYTLAKLMDLVKSIEMPEFSARYLEKPESLLKRILKLYWNGKASNMLEGLKSFSEIVQLSEEYAGDYESVVFISFERENLKKLANCDILKHDMYSTSEEFRSSWLNVDGQPADIEKVLSEPLLDDITMFKSSSDNTVVASASLGVNSLTDMSEVSSKEKSVNPDTCSLSFMQKAGNDRKEVTAENNGHSVGEKETFKKQEDIKQNQNVSTDSSDISPLVERSSETLTDLSNAKEAFRQDHEQTRDNASASLSQSLSDGVKNSEASHCNSKDTWEVENISDDENPSNKEALNNSADTWLFEDISDDENPGSNESVNNTSDNWLVEDISDDESSRNKEVVNSSDASDNKKPVVEDVSSDENSSDDSLFMGITVLSSEDAKKLFQQFEKEAECTLKTESQSNVLVACFDAPSQPKHECNKANTCSRCGAEIAIANSTNSTRKDCDADLFCLQCWEQAPLFELDEEPCSPVPDEANFRGYPARSKGLGQNCRLPCLKLEVCELTCDCIAYEGMKELKSDLVKSKLVETYSPPSAKIEVKEPAVAPNDECIVYEGMKKLKSDCLVKSKLVEIYSPPSVKIEVKEPAVSPNDEDIVYEGMKELKSDCLVKSKVVEIYSPPSVKLEVKEPAVSTKDECIAFEGLAKSEQEHNYSLPSLELQVLKPLETCFAEEALIGQNCSSTPVEVKVKKPTVASMKKCIVDEGQKRDSMMHSELRENQDVKMPEVSSPEECISDEGLKGDKSEMGQNHSSPSFELKVNESKFAFPKTCIADEGLIVHKSYCTGEELGQNRSPPCLKLEVNKPTVASVEDCFADKRLTGKKNDGMLKPAKRKRTEIKPNKQKNKKAETIRVPKLQSLKQFPKKTAFSKHKLISGSTSSGSGDSVLFTPDVVVKISWPRKKNPPGVSRNKRHSGESQKCSKVKKSRRERRDNSDRTSTNPRKNLTEKSNDTPPRGSENKLEQLHGILSLNKIKTTEPKKVRFDLFGSKTETQCLPPERRFSAPATLTVSECKDYTDALSAKQKVLSQWSSTFIPKTKKTSPPRSPQEKAPQKKKPQKPQDLLKSNMSALKSHLTHRAQLLASSESHIRKPFYHQKVTKTLSG
ncbi:uncharacterized protein [Garra rufa]|uniref:uncharacterized protein n=1 Tax=Garra rufa TaxID=137080 RepID=UPI003CCEE33B